MKLLVEKNTISLGPLMRSCQAAIEFFNPPTRATGHLRGGEGDMEVEEAYEEEEETVACSEMRNRLPRMEENAWMLLMLVSKVEMMMMMMMVVVVVNNQ